MIVDRSENMDQKGETDTTHVRMMWAKDHLSLTVPSSELRFRDKAVKIVHGRATQFVTEVDNNGVATLKRVQTGSLALNALRFAYVLVTILLTGFIFAAAIELILHVFLGILVDAGLGENGEPHIGFAVCGILSLPLFVTSLSSAVTLGVGLVQDVWSGFQFFHLIGASYLTLAEWVQFLVFIFIPLVVLSVTLMLGLENFWEISGGTFFFCAFSFYGLYCIIVVWHEITGSISYLQELKEMEGQDDSVLTCCKEIFLTRMKLKLAVCRHTLFVNTMSQSQPEEDSEDARFSKQSLSTWVASKILPSSFYRKCDPPVKLHTVNEALGTVPFMSKVGWSLDTLFCSGLGFESVTILAGPGALTKNQLRSSVACSVIGLLLLVLVVSAFIMFFSASGILLGVAIVVGVLFGFLPFSFALYRIAQRYRESFETVASASGDANTAILYMWEIYKVSEPLDVVCYIYFTFDLLLWYIIPLCAFFAVGNWVLGLLFACIGVISIIRSVFNPAALLRSYGRILPPVDALSGAEQGNIKRKRDSGKIWRMSARTNLIITRVSNKNTRAVWAIIFAICVLFATGMLFAGLFSSPDALSGKTIIPTYVDDFYAPPPQNLEYPTCKLNSKMSVSVQGSSPLVDWVFLAQVAYTSVEFTQGHLDAWFGPGVAIDDDRKVQFFRHEYGSKSTVHYKLITFPSTNASIVSIRGTQNAFDVFADMQLWMTAVFMQVVRALLPAGSMWTPVFPNLIKYINLLQVNNLEKVSYYRETSAFVRWLQSQENRSNTLAMTGHSLGGGLAIISGTQTKTPTIAVSGVNAKLSRKTFHPPLSKFDLDTYTFNVVPNRDPVAHIDDVANLFQNINCTAPLNDLIGCHDVLRSLCELLYKCGSEVDDQTSRPIPCECTTQYGYPEPRPRGNRTFREACESSK